MEKLSVLIVGCGNIAGGLDSNKIEDGPPLTHAGAFTLSPNFKIVGCVDIDKEKSKKFAELWNINNAYVSMEEALQADIQFDVISICCPTQYHNSYLNACLLLSPQLIFCEKPLTDSVKNTNKIKTACEQAGILLAVNYLRRWDEKIIRLKKEIQANKRGSLRSVVGYYNKGILNNGSHLIDILLFLIGDMRLKHVGQPNYDFFPNDPSVSVTLEAGSSVPVILVPGAKASDYSIFEIQMIFEKGMITMFDGGLRWIERQVVDSEVFDGYQVLDSGSENKGGYLDTMSNAVDNIWRALSQGDSLNSSGDTAIISQNLCERILLESRLR